MTKLLLAGDIHGNLHWHKRIIDYAVRLKVRHIMQLGDYGVWHGSGGERYLKGASDYAVENDVIVFFLPGNHENYVMLEEYATWEKNEDGHVEILPNIFYVGKVNAWNWHGKRFAAIGGAVSIDKEWRTEGVSWWPQEQLTLEERQLAHSLDPVDYLLSHDCPTTIPMPNLINNIDSHKHRQAMNRIADALRPKQWFHGHMHFPCTYTYRDIDVYSLGCDDAAGGGNMKSSTAILDIETGEVSEFYNEGWW